MTSVSIDNLNEIKQFVVESTTMKSLDHESEVSKVSYQGEGVLTELQMNYCLFLIRKFEYISSILSEGGIESLNLIKQNVKSKFLSYFSKGKPVKQSWKEIKSDKDFFQKCAYLLEIEDFAEHFRDFRPKNEGELDSMIRHERISAENALNKLKPRSEHWLMRHASLNRDANRLESDYYYAISKQSSETDSIGHLLITNSVGKGWTYADTNEFFECFFYLIRKVSKLNSLNFDCQISSYLTN